MAAASTGIQKEHVTYLFAQRGFLLCILNISLLKVPVLLVQKTNFSRGHLCLQAIHHKREGNEKPGGGMWADCKSSQGA